MEIWGMRGEGVGGFGLIARDVVGLLDGLELGRREAGGGTTQDS